MPSTTIRSHIRVLLVLAAPVFFVLSSASAQAADCAQGISSYTTGINCQNGWWAGSAQHTCTNETISVPTAGCCKFRAQCERYSGDSERNWTEITVNWPDADNVVNCDGTFKIFPCS